MGWEKNGLRKKMSWNKIGLKKIWAEKKNVLKLNRPEKNWAEEKIRLRKKSGWEKKIGLRKQLWPKKLNSCHSLERKMYINLNENISFVIICNAIHYPCHSKYDEYAAIKRTRAPPTHLTSPSSNVRPPPDVTFTANQSNGELAFVVNPHKLPRKRAGKFCLS